MNFKAFINIILFLLLNSSARLAYASEIEVDQGRMIGKEELSEEGRSYFAFRNIPFAEPPVGPLRFEAPRPPLKFDGGVLDATKEGPSCAQAALGYDEGVEDCLHLSVYTPKLPNHNATVSLPVLVWFHGGAFVTGSSNEYSPHLMMDRDIVLVIPQYRLGILGFFSLHSHSAGGNYGLLDQVSALKWINQNIAKFGGDPDRVTLGGDCAGGISSVLHMLSPLSQGLFHRAMSFSGSPLSHWALHPRHNRLGLLIAKHVKCPAYEQHVLIKCFRERSAEELLEAQKYILEARDLLIGNHKLAPSIQIPAFSHISTLFLEEHPLKLLLKGEFTKLPVLLGVTRDVGSYLVDMALYDFIFITMEKKDPEFVRKLIGILVKEIDFLNFEVEEEKFKNFYFSDWNFQDVDQAVPGLIEMLGDAAFNSPILTLAKLLSKYVETRLFRFDYDDGPKLFDLRHEDPSSRRAPIPSNSVSHGDELFFFLPNGRFNMTKEMKKVSKTMVDMICNFVQGSLPNQAEVRDRMPKLLLSFLGKKMEKQGLHPNLPPFIVPREPLEKWPLFSVNGLETTIIDKRTEHGRRFVEKRKEDFLEYIFQNQHEEILKKISTEGEIDINMYKRDEL